MRIDPIKLNGLDLLEKVLDLEADLPNRRQWTLNYSQHTLPTQVRLKQLAVLVPLFVPELSELNLRDGLEALIVGDFISERALEPYHRILDHMDREQLKAGYQTRPKNMDDEAVLRRLEVSYRSLVRFKKQIEVIHASNQGVLEADWYMRYVVMLRDAAKKSIEIGEIDYFLETIINPQQRFYSKADLIRELGYPSEDLFDLEVDSF